MARSPGEEEAEPSRPQGLQHRLAPPHLALYLLQDQGLEGEELVQLAHGGGVAEDHLHLPHLGGELPDEALGGGVGEGEDPVGALQGLEGEGLLR